MNVEMVLWAFLIIGGIQAVATICNAYIFYRILTAFEKESEKRAVFYKFYADQLHE